VLLVRRANGGPVIVALPPNAQAALRERLSTAVAPQPPHEHAAA